MTLWFRPFYQKKNFFFFFEKPRNFMFFMRFGPRQSFYERVYGVRHMASWLKNKSLKVNQVVLPSYQVWSGTVKWFRNYLKSKSFLVKVLSAGRHTPDARRFFVKWSPGSKTHKKHNISWFLKKKKKEKKIFMRNGRKHSHKIDFVTQKSRPLVWINSGPN